MTVGALVPAARATRAKLMVLLPLTMALLAIARQIVTGLDGRIEVDSAQETGTTFTIELPLTVREAALAAQ